MLWKRLRVLGSVAHYHPKCQNGTSSPHLDSVCVPVGKICIIRIVFQSLKVIAKGFYTGEHLSSKWNYQSIYLLHVKYLQKCSLLCKHQPSANKRSTLFYTSAFWSSFFFQNHARMLGVRLIHEFGLYTSLYGNFSVDPKNFSPINTCSELTFPLPLLF